MQSSSGDPVKSDGQNQFVSMVKECIDSKYALAVLQKFAQGKATVPDVVKGIPEANESEIDGIMEKISRYMLVEASVESSETYSLTASGREFLAILTDIERLKLRYQN